MTLRTALAAATCALALAACGEKQPEMSRIPTVTNPQAQGQPAGATALTATPASAPHAADPHAGMAAGMGAGMGIPPAPTVALQEDGNDVALVGVKFTLGEGWKKVQPASSMRAAQYELPGEAGPGEMVVFYFGPGQGGDAKSNIERWVGQFSNPESTTGTLAMDVADMEKDGLKVALVKTQGTYTPTAMGPMMPAQDPRPDQALFGMVIEGGPEGSVFIRATGPKATMDTHMAALEAMAQSVRKATTP